MLLLMLMVLVLVFSLALMLRDSIVATGASLVPSGRLPRVAVMRHRGMVRADIRFAVAVPAAAALAVLSLV